MKGKYLMGMSAVFLIAILGVSVISAFGGFMKPFEQDRESMQEEMQAIQGAIEDEDYESWKSLMEERIVKMQEQLTEENFEEIVSQYQEMQELKEFHNGFCDDDCPVPEEGHEFRGHFRGPIPEQE